jgi:hypothetical protein
MTDAYKKVGRGGAGNFYSKKDVEDVSKAAASVIPPFLLSCYPESQGLLLADLNPLNVFLPFQLKPLLTTLPISE